MDSSVSLEDRIWFLRVCHHVPFALYQTLPSALGAEKELRPMVLAPSLTYIIPSLATPITSREGKKKDKVVE